MPERVIYIPIQLLGRYSISISKKAKKNHIFFFHLEPQWNLVKLKHQPTLPDESGSNAFIGKIFQWETGLNGGFSYKYFFGDYDLLLGIGAGPHYISLDSRKQAGGFIFSDNFFAGLGRKVNEDWNVNVQFRFRHLSNAGLKAPNLGIDNLIILAGISKTS